MFCGHCMDEPCLCDKAVKEITVYPNSINFELTEISAKDVVINIENTKKLYEKALLEHCSEENLSVDDVKRKYQCPEMSKLMCSESHIVVWFSNGKFHSDSALYIGNKGWYTSWEGHEGCAFNDSYGFKVGADIMKIYKINIM